MMTVKNEGEPAYEAYIFIEKPKELNYVGIEGQDQVNNGEIFLL